MNNDAGTGGVRSHGQLRTSGLAALLTAALLLGATSGCAPMLIGAGVASTAAIANDRRTAGTMLDDQNIEFQVSNAIQADPELKEQTHINATCINGIVLLTGESPNDEFRLRIDNLVQHIPKVRRVHNEIVIAAPSSLLTRSSDSWITGKVKTSLFGDEEAQGGTVKVVTENGSVYLMGLVTQAEGHTATEVARSVSGVQRVVKVFEYLD